VHHCVTMQLIKSILLTISNLLSDISRNALSDLHTSCHTQNVITPSVIRHQAHDHKTRLLAEIKAAGEHNSSLNYPPHSQDNLNVTTGHWLLTNYLSAGQGRRARNSSCPYVRTNGVPPRSSYNVK
jgi:hypothetical protein